jgi:hypothetical protein
VIVIKAITKSLAYRLTSITHYASVTICKFRLKPRLEEILVVGVRPAPHTCATTQYKQMQLLHITLAVVSHR